MVSIELAGPCRKFELEMASLRFPRRLSPQTTITIEGLEPDAEYRMYLKLVRWPCRFYKAKGQWTEDARGFQAKMPVEEKMVLCRNGQRSGEYFMTQGISFDNVRISSDVKWAARMFDTLYVQPFFRYEQHLHIDRIYPGESSRRLKVVHIPCSGFFAVKKCQNFLYPLMDNFDPTPFFHHRLAPVIVVTGQQEIPFGQDDPDDYEPILLPDKSWTVRKCGRTFYIPNIDDNNNNN